MVSGLTCLLQAVSPDAMFKITQPENSASLNMIRKLGMNSEREIVYPESARNVSCILLNWAKRLKSILQAGSSINLSK